MLLHFIDSRVGQRHDLAQLRTTHCTVEEQGRRWDESWIRPRPSNLASFASRNTSLAGVDVFSLFWGADAILVDTAAFDAKLRLGKRRGSTMTWACGDRIPIAKKWDSPIYRYVSRMATQDIRF